MTTQYLIDTITSPDEVAIVRDLNQRVVLTHEHHRSRAFMLAAASAAETLDPHVGHLLVERLWLDATGDGVAYRAYTRRVQADTDAPNPRRPIPIFKPGGCSCCPGGMHPAGSVMSPSPISLDNTVVWDNGEHHGIEHCVPFRLVHYEAPPFEWPAPGQTKAYVYDAGVYAIEGWDGLPPQTLRHIEFSPFGVPDPTFVQWDRYQPCEVWLFEPGRVLHIHRVERIAGSMLLIGDQMGLIYSQEERTDDRTPEALYERLCS